MRSTRREACVSPGLRTPSSAARAGPTQLTITPSTIDAVSQGTTGSNAWMPYPAPAPTIASANPGSQGARFTTGGSLASRDAVPVARRVAEGADPLDRDVDGLPVHETAQPGWGAGHDHIAGQQRPDIADVLDQLGDRMQQILGVAVPPRFAVDRAAD